MTHTVFTLKDGYIACWGHYSTIEEAGQALNYHSLKTSPAGGWVISESTLDKYVYDRAKQEARNQFKYYFKIIADCELAENSRWRAYESALCCSDDIVTIVSRKLYQQYGYPDAIHATVLAVYEAQQSIIELADACIF